MKTYVYELPLVEPIRWGGNVYTARHGHLLCDNGNWGEAAPLPGFSRETLSMFGTTTSKIVGHNPLALSASMTFAHDGISRPLTPFVVPVSALLMGTPSQIVEKAALLADSPCQAVKLKVGGDSSAPMEAELVCRVREILRRDQTLRLDANRAWELAYATEVAHELQGCDIEYIEEPLRDPELLEEFYSEAKLPYALDETLGERDAFEAFPNVAAYVIKPTLLGGREQLQRFANTGKKLVFTGCFESGLGTLRVAQLSSELAPGVPVGLDTYSWLSEDVLETRLTMSGWRLVFDGQVRVNVNALRETSR